MNHRIAGILPRGFSVRAVEFRNGQREVTACALPGCVRTNMRECVPPPCTTSHAGGSCSQPPACTMVPGSCARSCSSYHGAQAQTPLWGAPRPGQGAGPSEPLGTPGLPRDEPGFPVWHGRPRPPHCAPLCSPQLHQPKPSPRGAPGLPAPLLLSTAQPRLLAGCHRGGWTRFGAPQLLSHPRAGAERRGSGQSQPQWVHGLSSSIFPIFPLPWLCASRPGSCGSTLG